VGKKLIIANWKMNLSVGEASLFVHKLGGKLGHTKDVEVVLAPTLLALQAVSLQIHHHNFKLAAQNFYWRDEGAYTGEVSATQLRGLVQYALVGHSERRHIFNEHSKDIRAKVQAAFRNNIIPVLCVGETAGERAMNETNDVLHDQLVGGLTNVTSEEVEHLVVAYEPVWAIGTGSSATPGDVETAVKAIRSQITHLFGPAAAKKVRVLYGGSVTADNAKTFLNAEGVDGLLVGGASLNVHSFADIVSAGVETDSKRKHK
jgi:triosephosphate isomerase